MIMSSEIHKLSGKKNCLRAITEKVKRTSWISSKKKVELSTKIENKR